MSRIRIGHGFDIHRLRAVQEGYIPLGGVHIAAAYEVVAHSDGDVAIHALCDALLGALALGDIGHHFPDKDPTWAGAQSVRLLDEVMDMVRMHRYAVVNADITILADTPRVAPHVADMRRTMAGYLRVESQDVSVKATTTEGLGSIGAREAIAAHAVVLLERP